MTFVYDVKKVCEFIDKHQLYVYEYAKRYAQGTAALDNCFIKVSECGSF